MGRPAGFRQRIIAPTKANSGRTVGVAESGRFTDEGPSSRMLYLFYVRPQVLWLGRPLAHTSRVKVNSLARASDSIGLGRILKLVRNMALTGLEVRGNLP
jgi:hypothetical protein